MARQPRLVLAGQVHLVRQQGHNGMSIAVDDVDRERWLALLRDAAVTHQLLLHAWALADKQFSLLVTPPDAQALSRMMQTLGRRYVGWFNTRHQRSGTLWDGRYQACAVEAGSWELTAMRLVEGPHVGGLPPEYAQQRAGFSSARHHLGLAVDSSLVATRAYWRLGNTPFEREAAWRRLADQPLPEAARRAAESSLRSGRPLASTHFIEELEDRLARQLLPRPRGRPARTR